MKRYVWYAVDKHVGKWTFRFTVYVWRWGFIFPLFDPSRKILSFMLGPISFQIVKDFD